jgi:hypothetical protein
MYAVTKQLSTFPLSIKQTHDNGDYHVAMSSKMRFILLFSNKFMGVDYLQSFLLHP